MQAYFLSIDGRPPHKSSIPCCALPHPAARNCFRLQLLERMGTRRDVPVERVRRFGSPPTEAPQSARERKRNLNLGVAGLLLFLGVVPI